MVCVSEVWVVGDRISSGMQEELELAKSWNIPIKKIVLSVEGDVKSEEWV